MPISTDSKFANVTHVDTKLVDLSYAAELSVKSVVHVKTQYGGQSSGSTI